MKKLYSLLFLLTLTACSAGSAQTSTQEAELPEVEQTDGVQETALPGVEQIEKGQKAESPEIEQPDEAQETIPSEIEQPDESQEVALPEVAQPDEAQETALPDVEQPNEGQEVILYRYDDAERTDEGIDSNMSLILLNTSGEETILREDIDIRPSQIYISPDRSQLSFRESYDDIYVLTIASNEMRHYPLEAEDDAWNQWYVWGWLDTSHIVLSETIEGRVSFYTLDTSIDEFNLELMPRLTEFFTWDVGAMNELTTPWQGAFSFFRFDPTFNYVLTPVPRGEGIEHGIGYDIFLWDLSISIEEPVAVIQFSYPWWMVINYWPAWQSPPDSLLALSISDHEGGISDLYTLDVSTHNIDLVTEFDSEGSDGLYHPAYMQWDSTNTQIAYWKDFGDPEIKKELTIDNIETSEQRTIFESFGGIIHWSSDGEYIAFATHKTLYVIDSRTGEIQIEKSFEKSSETDLDSFSLVGWVIVP